MHTPHQTQSLGWTEKCAHATRLLLPDDNVPSRQSVHYHPTNLHLHLCTPPGGECSRPESGGGGAGCHGAGAARADLRGCPAQRSGPAGRRRRRPPGAPAGEPGVARTGEEGRLQGGEAGKRGGVVCGAEPTAGAGGAGPVL
eukprot:9441302-Pyramimonas_sp.AAC.1